MLKAKIVIEQDETEVVIDGAYDPETKSFSFSVDAQLEAIEEVEEVDEPEVKDTDEEVEEKSLEQRVAEFIEETNAAIEAQVVEQKLAGKDYEVMQTALEVKNIDNATGTFSGYGAVFGNIDSHNDVIMPNAFSRTIASKARVPLLAGHNQERIIGVAELSQDEHGLLVQGTLAMGTPEGKAAHELMQLGITGLSIGYIATRAEREKKSGIRQISEARILELSHVAIPSNDLTHVFDVRSHDETEIESKSVEVEDVDAELMQQIQALRDSLTK